MDPVYNRAYFGLMPWTLFESRWPEVKALLEKAAAHGHGELEVDEVLPMLIAFKAALHVMAHPDTGKILLAVVSRVAVPERGPRVLEIPFVAGRGGIYVLADHMTEFYECARVMQASAIRCWCRPAVARYLRRYLPGATFEEGARYITVTKEVPA